MSDYVLAGRGSLEIEDLIITKRLFLSAGAGFQNTAVTPTMRAKKILDTWTCTESDLIF